MNINSSADDKAQEVSSPPKKRDEVKKEKENATKKQLMQEYLNAAAELLMDQPELLGQQEFEPMRRLMEDAASHPRKYPIGQPSLLAGRSRVSEDLSLTVGLAEKLYHQQPLINSLVSQEDLPIVQVTHVSSSKKTETHEHA